MISSQKSDSTMHRERERDREKMKSVVAEDRHKHTQAARQPRQRYAAKFAEDVRQFVSSNFAKIPTEIDIFFPREW